MFSLFGRYSKELVNYDGGLSLVMLDGLLLIPVILAAFFYPMGTLIAVGGILLVTLIAYEGYVLWRKRHRI